MKIMFLAAGEGKRLRPITESLPKCMVPVNGKPILEHNLTWARKFGFDEVFINLYHLPEQISGFFQDGKTWGVTISYSYEPEMLGSAGGVKKLEGVFDSPFCVWYADNLSTCQLDCMMNFHKENHALATIALLNRQDTSHSGIVGFDNHFRVERFLEKPQPDQVFSHWVNAGIYMLDPLILEFIPERIPSDFGKDIFPKILALGKPIFAYCLTPSESLWWIDTPADLEDVQKQFPKTGLALN